MYFPLIFWPKLTQFYKFLIFINLRYTTASVYNDYKSMHYDKHKLKINNYCYYEVVFGGYHTIK
jgi:hypothetical protein